MEKLLPINLGEYLSVVVIGRRIKWVKKERKKNNQGIESEERVERLDGLSSRSVVEKEPSLAHGGPNALIRNKLYWFCYHRVLVFYVRLHYYW